MDIWTNSIRFVMDNSPEGNHFITNGIKVYIKNVKSEEEIIKEEVVHDGHYYCRYLLDEMFKDIIIFHGMFIHISRYRVEKFGFIGEPEPRYINYAYIYKLLNNVGERVKLVKNGWKLCKFVSTTNAIYTMIGGYQDDWNSNMVQPVITDLSESVIVRPQQKLEHFKTGGFEISFNTFLNASNTIIYPYKPK